MIPADLYQKIRRLELRTRGRVETAFGGRYHSAFKGRGMTFAEVRPYAAGDDVRSIDWNVTARMGEPFVKVFEEEREQTVLVVADVSDSAGTGLSGRTRRDTLAEVCALLALSATMGGDHAGLVLFAGAVERYVPPARSRLHGLRLIRDVYAHTARTPGTDLDAALTFARRVLRRRATLVVVSDFLATGYEPTLRALSAKHDVVAVHLIDPREGVLPPSAGLVALRDAESGETMWVDTRDRATRAAYAERTRQRHARTAAAILRAGAARVVVKTDEDPVVPLGRFFAQRTKQGRGRA